MKYLNCYNTVNVKEIGEELGIQLGWKDNVQFFSSAKGRGTVEPTWSNIGNGQYAFKFTVGDELFITFHVNHDYKIGSKAYPHVHFITNDVMSIGQIIEWEFSYVIARGHSQGDSLTIAETTIILTYTATGNEIAGEHIVVECNDLDSVDLIEPDAVMMARVQLKSSNVTGDVFGIMCDLHYLSEVDNTDNKKPPFND